MVVEGGVGLSENESSSEFLKYESIEEEAEGGEEESENGEKVEIVIGWI